MWRNNKVLVIDDNSSRRHDLNVLLEFLSDLLGILVEVGECLDTSVCGTVRLFFASIFRLVISEIFKGSYWLLMVISVSPRVFVS